MQALWMDIILPALALVSCFSALKCPRLCMHIHRRLSSVCEGEIGGGIEVAVEEEFSGSVGTLSGEGTANCIERSGGTSLLISCTREGIERAKREGGERARSTDAQYLASWTIKLSMSGLTCLSMQKLCRRAVTSMTSFTWCSATNNVRQ